MKILHVSDTHLGFSAYQRVDPETGLNVRELDFFNAFKNFVETALKLQPDAIIHTGDLFNSTRPTNRAIAFALETVKTLVDADIKFVVICGNHSTPKLPETGNIFRVLEKADFSNKLFAIYQPQAALITIENTAIQAVPHIIEKEKFEKEVATAKPLEDYQYNLLLLHAGVTGIKVFQMGDFNELVIDTALLANKNFDYIALGHYHRCTAIFENVYYAGSIERLKFDEAHEEKGFLEIDLDRKSVKIHPLPTRPMVDLPQIDCKQLTPYNITAEIMNVLESVDITDKIVRLNLINLSKELEKAIDYVRISNYTKDALALIKNRCFLEEEMQRAQKQFGPITAEYISYLDSIDLKGFDKDWLKNKGLELLTQKPGE